MQAEQLHQQEGHSLCKPGPDQGPRAGVDRRLRQQALLQLGGAAERHARAHAGRVRGVCHPAVAVQLPLRRQRCEPGALVREACASDYCFLCTLLPSGTRQLSRRSERVSPALIRWRQGVINANSLSLQQSASLSVTSANCLWHLHVALVYLWWCVAGPCTAKPAQYAKAAWLSAGMQRWSRHEGSTSCRVPFCWGIPDCLPMASGVS